MTLIVERDITYYLQQRNTEKRACPETNNKYHHLNTVRLSCTKQKTSKY